MSVLKVMQVGIGGYGEAYLKPMLENLPNDRWELVGVVDPMADKSSLFSQIVEKRIPVYSSIEEFYTDASADLVIIAAPISFHRFYTVFALEHGSNVLCEKPIAATMSDAEAMREAEQRFGKFVAIGFQWSFSDAMLAAKQDYLDGKFGKPVQFKTHVLWARGWNYYARNNWAGRYRDRQGNWVLDSVAHNATAHYLHSQFFMQGAALDRSAQPVTLQAELYRANDIENFDTCALRAVTDTGCEVLYYATHAVDRHDEPVFEYRYERATLRYNGGSGAPQNRLIASYPDGTTREYGSPDPGTYGKLMTCLDAIESGKPVPCGIQTAMAHLITINFLADHAPIHAFPQESVIRDSANQRTYVPGLAEALLQCYDAGKLPSESGFPWAAPAPVMQTAGYKGFPASHGL